MSASRLKNGSIRFRGIANEAQYSDVTYAAENAKCKVETKDNMTVITISGTAKQMKSFENSYFE